MKLRFRSSRATHRRSIARPWLEIRRDESTEHQGAIARVRARDVDGIRVIDAFSPEEVSTAVQALDDLRDTSAYPSMFGSMLGMALPDLTKFAPDPSDRTAYLDDSERTSALLKEAFGFDPHERVAEVLGPMADGLAITPPEEDGRRYKPGNVRWFDPGRGGLPAHAGNEFQLQGDETSAHLRATTEIRDHFSYFVVLQAPESGGALSLYDLEFGAHQPAQPQWTDVGRQDADFDAQPAHRVPPVAGSLVLFGGGWRWHRVEPIEGALPRITYGGFAGPRRDGQALHLWV